MNIRDERVELDGGRTVLEGDAARQYRSVLSEWQRNVKCVCGHCRYVHPGRSTVCLAIDNKQQKCWCDRFVKDDMTEEE